MLQGIRLTKHLRVIRNAWRFRFAQVQPSVAHTLMRRYATSGYRFKLSG